VELLRISAVAGDSPVLQVDGEIDVSTAEQLHSALEQALAADPTVVVDMAGVTFCDAAGLRVVLQVAASLNGTGPLTLLNAARVRRLLEIVGMSDLSCIDVRDDCGPRDR
jgi:anti-anti-sigma factor